ncbi:S-layer homology domain-containing protein [Bacillus dakarensis]|uniref:S-layer homology domain-containing protein n=1 Tax=Robertmurraya dakarensis TaxID=1926278 RepID=UPI0009815D84|nr:S-layer homology domain-containing protein [Bacillus dakarensis]
MAYQPKSYRKFLAGTVTAAVVASAVAPAASAAFSDVSANDTHAINVNKAVEMGLINGYPDGTFGTYQDITRGQVAKIIARYLGNVDTTGVQQFTDVATSPDTELKAAALKVRAAGVFTGSDGALNAGKNITRQEMASVVARLFELTDIEDVESKVTDNDSAWEVHRANINLLSEHGITTEATFNPLGNVKRGQFASFIVRAIEKVQEVKIEKVTVLDTVGAFVEVQFNKPVVGVEASDIIIQDADSKARKGVKDVKLSSNGKIATIELFTTDERPNVAEMVLDTLKYYDLTVFVNGETIQTSFIRPAHVNERVVEIDPKDRTIKVGSSTINIPKDTEFDYADAFGREVNAWFNKDRDLVNISYVEEDVVVDSFEVVEEVSTTEDGEIKVKSSGDVYTLSEDVEVYLNDEKKTASNLFGAGTDGDKYDYAKLLFDKNGDVELILAYNWDDFIVVDSMDEDVVIAGDDSELDLEDYLIMKDGKQITAGDIEEGDIIYFNEDANEKNGVAEVLNTTVTGEIEDVFAEYIRIDGKDYKYTSVKYNGKKTQFLDGDKFKDLSDNDAEEFQAGGEVTLFLDRKGDVVFITGAQEDVDSNTVGFHSVEAPIVSYNNGIKERGIVEIEGLTTNSEEKLYEFRIDALDMITNAAGTEFEVDENFPGTSVEIDKFALADNASGNATGNVIALDENGNAINAGGTTVSTSFGTATVIVDLSVSAADNALFEVKTNDNGQVKELEFLNSDNKLNTNNELKLDDKFVNGYRLLSDTIVLDGSEGWDASKSGSEYNPDADEIEVTTWADLKDKGFDITEATYYYNEDDEVEYLVIENSDAEDTTLYNGVVTKVIRNTSDEIVEVKVFVDGKEETYKVDKVKDGSIAKGKTVVLEINDNTDLVKDVDVIATKSGKVDAVSVANKTITVDGSVYSLDNGADVYDYTGSNIETEQFRDVKVGDSVTVVYSPNSTRFIDVVLVTSKASNTQNPTPTTATGTVEAPEKAKVGEAVTITVKDADLNKSATTVEKVTVTVGAANVELTETGVNTGIFSVSYTVAGNAGDQLEVVYADAADATGKAVEAKTTITVEEAEVVAEDIATIQAAKASEIAGQFIHAIQGTIVDGKTVTSVVAQGIAGAETTVADGGFKLGFANSEKLNEVTLVFYNGTEEVGTQKVTIQ